MPRAKKEDTGAPGVTGPQGTEEEQAAAEAIADALEEERLLAIVEADKAKQAAKEVEAPKSSKSKSRKTEKDSGTTTGENAGGTGNAESEENEGDGASDGNIETPTQETEIPVTDHFTRLPSHTWTN